MKRSPQPGSPQLATLAPTGSAPTHCEVEASVLALVGKRGIHSSACPSEVARQLWPHDWRALMPKVREVVSDLARAGQISVTQRGVEQPAAGPWKGPIRISLVSTKGSIQSCRTKAKNGDQL